jgi:tRNA-Thr(GGU) m(6)t(6)A37 methyltransferase TsaA
MQITLTPIGYVRATRANPTDDNWDSETTRIELDTSRFNADALLSLDTYSHVEVLYWFHHTEAATPTLGARHPRGNTAWPLAGVFAQRGKNRPNRIGLTTCEVLKVDGTTLHLKGLDAIDGTPVLDLKPWMSGFAPRGEIREPEWAKELMAAYW